MFAKIKNPPTDGQKVYDQIVQVLENDLNVRISFLNVERLTSAFLNVAIGQLYGKYNDDFLRLHLSATDIEADDSTLLRRVIATAKLYFKDPARFNSMTFDHCHRNYIIEE